MVPPPARVRPAAGADAGASLIKLALRAGDGRTEYHLLPSDAIERAAAEIESIAPERVGLTGGGAPKLARLLECDTTGVDEFEAWRAGAEALLEHEGLSPQEPYLLVSIGTGTSVMQVRDGSISRVGGTALGGGVLMGLGRVLLGTADFDEIVALARGGDRRKVDLLVSDIYPGGEFLLAGEINAASFGKLARARADAPDRHDLADALVGMVGENVGLICAGLAGAAEIRRIVFGGSTLRGNPRLWDVLRAVGTALGRDPVMLPEGEFTGALGALQLVAADR